MTDLHQLFAERAARAGQDEDIDRLLALVRERAEQRAHRRRNLLAAGGGVAAVAALVAAALVLPRGGNDDRGAPAGGVASTAAPSFTRSNVLSASPTAAGTPVTLDPSTGAPVRLVPVGTPKNAAVAISRVPVGWRYTGHSGPVTFYGPDSSPLNDNPDFTGVIVVDVHERVKPDGPNALHLAGSTGRYSNDSGVQIVSVIVDSTTEMDVQIPANARVTRSQALSIADSLQLRSKAQKTHG